MPKFGPRLLHWNHAAPMPSAPFLPSVGKFRERKRAPDINLQIDPGKEQSAAAQMQREATIMRQCKGNHETVQGI